MEILERERERERDRERIDKDRAREREKDEEKKNEDHINGEPVRDREGKVNVMLEDNGVCGGKSAYTD